MLWKQIVSSIRIAWIQVHWDSHLSLWHSSQCKVSPSLPELYSKSRSHSLHKIFTASIFVFMVSASKGVFGPWLYNNPYVSGGTWCESVHRFRTGWQICLNDMVWWFWSVEQRAVSQAHTVGLDWGFAWLMMTANSIQASERITARWANETQVSGIQTLSWAHHTKHRQPLLHLHVALNH